ncbi:hypothetical protein M8Z33_07345 [Streptomyces sp. ZAF1911]|uniref:hypothetical protein n=1 Tax=Streptomyces sp. ZAF1911 TaxID=2944129 RepID=UPI00237B3722|nr:hypothetical protein [Streptomyces sp. ZAF1911]MDD9376488.1 hypothetical protein [Streptomyces sp. ZAF1911]
MKRSAISLLTAGVLVTGCSSAPPAPRSPRTAYEDGWTALRDGRAEEGSESSCAGLVDSRESQELQDAVRQGCTDRVLLRGNKSDEFSDAMPTGASPSKSPSPRVSPSPVKTVYVPVPAPAQPQRQCRTVKVPYGHGYDNAYTYETVCD